jgi:hypothetical protein
MKKHNKQYILINDASNQKILNDTKKKSAKKKSTKKESTKKDTVVVSKKTSYIPKSLKVKVWNDNFGRQCGEHECYIECGKIICQGDFECGHVISKKNDGDTTVENLKPICSQCNKSMGTVNLEEFKKTYFSPVKKININAQESTN